MRSFTASSERSSRMRAITSGASTNGLMFISASGFGEVGVRPGAAALVAGAETGDGEMRLAVDRIVDVEIVDAARAGVAVDHHEVSAAAVPADACAHGPAGIDLGLHLIEWKRPHHAHEVVGPCQGEVEEPWHVARS